MKHTILTILVILLTFAFCGCTNKSSNSNLPVEKSTSTPASNDLTDQTAQASTKQDKIKVGHIHLYGEEHAVKRILEKELDLWKTYYHDKGLRHLFIEQPYYSAEYLNLWMHADNDVILEELYKDWVGTSSHSENVLNFYKSIKAECPETIFHGIDVGHQHQTTGKRFLEYLKSNHQENTEMYKRTEESIQQGQHYYGIITKDHVYRENTMTQNFIREYNLLNGADIMGIFGGAHTDIVGMNYQTHQVPCMANQLKAIYGDALRAKILL